ncbi:hypothetical protein Thermo_01736 [Thermoplasmatales archaeon]|nr:hypothetical protein Thermo_01736 [Thermoplasmatales archaeon]
MTGARLKAAITILIAVAFLSTGISSATVLVHNPVLITSSPTSSIVQFSSNGSSSLVAVNISNDLSELNASISAIGFYSNSSRVSDQLTLNNGNYTVLAKPLTSFMATQNSTTFRIAGSTNFSGILYSPINDTNYSYVIAPSNATISIFGFPFVKGQSEEFITATGEFVNEVSLLLSGNGSFNFSMGSTLYGSQIASNESVVVTGTNYYNISIPVAFLSGETPYYLNLYRTSGNPAWRSVIQQDVSSGSNISSYGNIDSFLTISLRGYNFPSNISVEDSFLSGVYSVGFNPQLGHLPRNVAIFYEYGLKSGTSWSVLVNGSTYVTQGKFIEVNGTQGATAYSTVPVPGYSAVSDYGIYNQSGYSIVIPIVFHIDTTAPLVGANSTHLKYGLSKGSQEFTLPGGGIIDHVSILLKGSGRVNISIGYSLSGSQIMGNKTLSVNGSGWYSVSVPTIFFSGSSSYFLNVYSVNGNVKWAYSQVSHAVSINTLHSYFYKNDKLKPSNSRVYIFNLTYVKQEAFNTTGRMIFVEYGLPSGTNWAVDLLSQHSINIGSVITGYSSLLFAHANMIAVSGPPNSIGISFSLSNNTSTRLQFTYTPGSLVNTGSPVGFTPLSPLVMGINLIPYTTGAVKETFGIYLVAHSGSVTITLPIVLTVSLSFYEITG